MASQTVELLFDTQKAEKSVDGVLSKLSAAGGAAGDAIARGVSAGASSFAQGFGTLQTAGGAFGGGATQAAVVTGAAKVGEDLTASLLKAVPVFGAAFEEIFRREADNIRELALAPSRAAGERVGAIAGPLAAIGVQVPEAAIRREVEVQREMARRDMEARRHVNDIAYGAGIAMDGLSRALSFRLGW